MLKLKDIYSFSWVTYTLLSLIICPQMTHAQEQGPSSTPAIGMHHLTPKPAPNLAVPAPATPTTTSSSAPSPEPQKLPEYTPLTTKEALVKPEDFQEWDHNDDILSAHTKPGLEKLAYLIESDRGAVAPTSLFLAAKSFADQKDMEKAALYFFVGQLRLTFDVARWPPRANAEDVKRLSAENLKAPDQKQNESGQGPRIENPHLSVINLANSLSHPILVWAMKEPGRLDKILDKVKQWDMSSPYAYTPGYDTGPAAPFETWPKLLTDVRENYFKQMRGLSRALGKVQ